MPLDPTCATAQPLQEIHFSDDSGAVDAAHIVWLLAAHARAGDAHRRAVSAVHHSPVDGPSRADATALLHAATATLDAAAACVREAATTAHGRV